MNHHISLKVNHYKWWIFSTSRLFVSQSVPWWWSWHSDQLPGLEVLPCHRASCGPPKRGSSTKSMNWVGHIQTELSHVNHIICHICHMCICIFLSGTTVFMKCYEYHTSMIIADWETSYHNQKKHWGPLTVDVTTIIAIAQPPTWMLILVVRNHGDCSPIYQWCHKKVVTIPMVTNQLELHLEYQWIWK